MIGQVQKPNARDYEKDLNKYIASPLNDYEYKFNIGGLRAGEKKWLGKTISLRKKKNLLNFTLNYKVRSKKTDGTVCGKLVCCQK